MIKPGNIPSYSWLLSEVQFWISSYSMENAETFVIVHLGLWLTNSNPTAEDILFLFLVKQYWLLNLCSGGTTEICALQKEPAIIQVKIWFYFQKSKSLLTSFYSLNHSTHVQDLHSTHSWICHMGSYDLYILYINTVDMDMEVQYKKVHVVRAC